MDEIQKAKSEMKLVRSVKDKNKDFYKWITRKRKTGEHIDLLLNGLASLVTKGMEKAAVLFAFVVTGEVCCQTSLRLCLVAEFRGDRCYL